MMKENSLIIVKNIIRWSSRSLRRIVGRIQGPSGNRDSIRRPTKSSNLETRRLSEAEPPAKKHAGLNIGPMHT